MPLVVVYPAYLLDDSGRSLWDTFTWSMRQGFRFWGSTFLVQARAMTADNAAGMITFYYIGIAFGRFLSGLLANKLSSGKLIQIGQGILLAALVLVILPLPAPAAGVGLFLIGAGNGPVFPNMLHLTPETFGKEISQSVMGAQMAVSYIGILLAPALFGLIAQAISAALLPYYLLVFYGAMTAGSFLLKRAS